MLERQFKKHLFKFLVISFIGAGLIASGFQEMGNAVTNLLVQIPWCNNWGCILGFWFIVVVILVLVAFKLDKHFFLKSKNPIIRWQEDNANDFARIFFENDDADLKECYTKINGTIRENDNNEFSTKSRNFSWATEGYRGEDQRVTDIPKGEVPIINIAKVKDKKLVLTFAYHTQTIEKVGIYDISFSLVGYKNEYKFETDPCEISLDFDGASVKIKLLNKNET